MIRFIVFTSFNHAGDHGLSSHATVDGVMAGISEEIQEGNTLTNYTSVKAVREDVEKMILDDRLTVEFSNGDWKTIFVKEIL